MPIPQQQTAATLLPRLTSGSQRRQWLGLFAEGAIYTGIGLAFMHASASEQAGVFAIFLAAAALLGPFNTLLTENREAIWDRGEDPRRANRRSVVGVLAMFLGMLIAFAVAALLQGEARSAATFRIALEAANIDRDTILTRRFGSMGGLVLHNVWVLVTIVALAFVYRSYGALLALTWNAALWAVVFCALVQRAIHSTQVPMLAFAAISAAAVFPHLVLEALAYVTAALAAIFMSKGMAKYGVSDPKFRAVVLASGRLVLAAIAILVVAAAAEHFVAPNVLSLIRSS
jgi:hypothetical protein